MTELMHYDVARRALADAKTLNEVMEIANKASAVKEYARRAKDRQMETDAAELRIRAERRLGEILTDAKSGGHIAQGRPRKLKAKDLGREMRGERITLTELGVTHKLSSLAQGRAAIPSDKFEASITRWRGEMLAGRPVKVKSATPRRARVPDDLNNYLRHDGVSLRNLPMACLSNLARTIDAILSAPEYDARATVGSIYSDQRLLEMIKRSEGRDS